MLWGERRSYQLTRADLAAAYRINLVDKLRHPWRLAAFALIIALAAIGTWFAKTAGDLVIIASVLVFLAVLAVVRVTLGAWWLAGKSLRSQPVLGAPHELTFAENRLCMRNEAGDSTFRWGSFHKARIHRDFVLLFMGHEVFVPVPRRAFRDDDVAELARHLASAGVRLVGDRVP